MVVSSKRFSPDLFKRRSFVELMGIYEKNYQRLRRLLGDLHRLPEEKRIQLAGRPGLIVEIQKRSPYTLEMRLSHQFAEERLPDVMVRCYHDAGLAEALPVPQRWAGLAADPVARLPARWDINILLYKWLEYCLDADGQSQRPYGIAN